MNPVVGVCDDPNCPICYHAVGVLNESSPFPTMISDSSNWGLWLEPNDEEDFKTKCKKADEIRLEL